MNNIDIDKMNNVLDYLDELDREISKMEAIMFTLDSLNATYFGFFEEIDKHTQSKIANILDWITNDLENLRQDFLITNENLSSDYIDIAQAASIVKDVRQ